MNDISLYTKILGIEQPWVITNIDLNIGKEEVKIYIKYDDNKAICPECKKEYSFHDKRETRTWRHLDTCQMKTYLIADIPRINCSIHGIRSINVPWSESHSHFTLLFERFVIELLQATQNQTKAAKILRISFDQINLIMQKAVNRGLSRRKSIDIEYLGIDEKSMQKGHTYLTVISDTKNNQIIDLIQNRTYEATSILLTNISELHNTSNLKAVSMDMWKPFMKGVSDLFPKADIVHDKFHIIKYLNDAIDKTRKSEVKTFSKNEINPLKKTKYLFLKNPENLTKAQSKRFDEVNSLSLKTSKAWQIKENFKEFYKSSCIYEAIMFFNKWAINAKESGLKHVIKVVNMLEKHSLGLFSYIEHKTNNGLAENINGRIQQIKTVGRGFSSFKNYRNAILFYLGKLDMFPHKTQ